MNPWEGIFKSKGRVFDKPQKELVALVKTFKSANVKKILDLGCGSGRHTVMLAKEGFELYSSDESPTAVNMTRQWLEKEALSANLQQFSCYEKFPFADSFFDAVISTRVIYHNYHEKVLFCISEISRVTKSGGFIFLMVPDQRYKNRDIVLKQVEDHTFVPETGDEIGTPHVIYDDELIQKDFGDFEIVSVTHGGEDHYIILLKKKIN